MSIFYDIASVLRDITSLILPRTCLVCGRRLLENEEGMCLMCQYNIPLTNFTKKRNNPVKLLFENLLPIESATAMFWFVGGTEWQSVIHKFKYYGRWLFAQKMGEWLGEELRESEHFNDLDLIIPIPLHFNRRLFRGYNQSEQLALGIGRKMGIKCDFHSVRRTKYNDSQTSKKRIERWDNVEHIFTVQSVERLRGRHILLVDDVITTGATISSCATAIIAACNGDVRISVATLAVSRRVING